MSRVRVTWLALVLLIVVMMWVSPRAHAQDAGFDQAALAPLVSGDTDAKLVVIQKLGSLLTPQAVTVLSALNNDQLYVLADGRLVVVDASGQHGVDAVSGQPVAVPSDANDVSINNRLRREIQSELAGAELFSSNPARRLAAASRLQDSADPARLPLIAKALGRESDPDVRAALMVAQARLQLTDPDPKIRAAAVEQLGASRKVEFRPVLMGMLAKAPDGSNVEPDATVRAAAEAAVQRIDSRLELINWVGNAFYGLSLGSVLLLAALGLAITFGLMGVINMAHGELLMIGAYVTYVVQLVFQHWLPGLMNWYVLAAVPAAFVVTGLVGMALERTVIRWLYGRPLETLLATWGISLILMQAVRSIFGAQNVEVANPSWMSGGVTLLGGLVLTYNRIATIVFAGLVVVFVWLLLNHTRLGLFVRAITQNRRMADCVGVPTGRVDMLAFGLGSGIAGLAGVALSQLGNVGPDLGQTYIVDSFMVVVLGGVGQLAGTVFAGLGLGIVNKFLEPYAGAVLAKIVVLVIIVLVVQKRPQGLFAPKGRSVE